jgi:hypothetical protein
MIPQPASTPDPGGILHDAVKRAPPDRQRLAGLLGRTRLVGQGVIPCRPMVLLRPGGKGRALALRLIAAHTGNTYARA